MRLSGKRVLCYVEDVYEDLELWYPKLRLEEEGAEVVVAGPSKRTYTGKHGYPCPADAAISETDHRGFDALLLPGGFAPDQLRRLPPVLEAVRWFHAQKKPIAFICHAGWIPISAGILKGVRATSTPGIKDDMANAGCEWVDEPCVVDGHLVSARRPPDLPAFALALADLMASGA
jgi:protease I